MSIKLVLEMEAGDQLSGENNKVEAANVATEVEAATAELTEVGGEAEEYAEGIETSVDAAGELQEVHDTLGASVEDGEGVSEETAKMAEIAVEAICAKVGISARETRMIPAMESFGSANSRLTATKLAMEGIKETAKRIWEAIKKACIHVWNVIKNFFAGLIKSRTMLEKHLKNLKDRAGKAEGAPKNKTFSAGAKAFSIDGVAGPDKVFDVLEDSVKLMELSKKFTEILGSQTSKIITDYEPLNKGANLFKALSVRTGLHLQLSGETTENVGKAYGYLAYGKVILVAEIDNLSAIGIVTAKQEFAKEITAPTKEEILKVIQSAQDTLKTLQEFDKVFKNLESINKTLVSTADKMMNARADMAKATSEKKEEDDNHAEANDATTVRALNKMVSTIGTATPNLVFAAVKAAADYANAGINNLANTEKK